MFSLDLIFMQAKADIIENKVVKASRVEGRILDDGNIIFHWIDGEVTRKMVLTSNHGQTIKDGFLPVSESSWVNPDTWKTETKGLYAISKFTPRQGKVYYHAVHEVFERPAQISVASTGKGL